MVHDVETARAGAPIASRRAHDTELASRRPASLADKTALRDTQTAVRFLLVLVWCRAPEGGRCKRHYSIKRHANQDKPQGASLDTGQGPTPTMRMPLRARKG